MAYLLLTGATGLLGGYLLRDAMRQGLPVAVVVRRSAAYSARRRIDAVLAPFEKDRALPRPVVLEGDLSQPGLGLSQADSDWIAKHCDRVLHSAASICFYRDEKSGEPYRTNVDGTRNLVELSARLGIGEFHHVSTAYVCGRRAGRVYENELDVGQDHGNDYEASKVASEKLVRAAGFRSTAIYRPSIIIGDSQTGYTTTFHGFYTPVQVAFHLGKSDVQKEAARNFFFEQLGLQGNERKNIVPVDWVSEVIWRLLQTPESHGRTYHLTSEDPPTTQDLAIAIDRLLEEYFASNGNRKPASSSDEEWAMADLRRHMDVYRAYFRDHPEFDTSNLRQAAADLPCPRVDQAMLQRTGRYALEANFGWPRKAPPAVPASVEALVASFEDMPGAAQELCSLEITGPGGGCWTLNMSPATGRPALVHVGRSNQAVAHIRLRSDVLAALQAKERTHAQALQAARVMVLGSPASADRAVAWLERILSLPLENKAIGVPANAKNGRSHINPATVRST